MSHDQELSRLVRPAVVDLVRSHRERYLFAAMLHVGQPGGPAFRLELQPEDHFDHGLRTDVVACLLARAIQADIPNPIAWLTRPGVLEVADADLAWAAATRKAFDEAEARWRFVVVTRGGWMDPIEGQIDIWKRPRSRARSRLVDTATGPGER